MNSASQDQEREQELSEGVRISDRRRIDPVTFEARQPATPAAAPAGPAAPAGAGAPPSPARSAEQPAPSGADAALSGADAALVDAALAEAAARAESALADAKRIAAEYANYRRRVDRDRDLQRDLAVGSVIADLLPILDDIGRARQHDEFSGGFRAVGEALEAVALKFGLETFGEAGEPFDPAEHEAMTSEHSDEVTEPTVRVVYQTGYRLRGRLLRPARVGVADNA